MRGLRVRRLTESLFHRRCVHVIDRLDDRITELNTDNELLLNKNDELQDRIDKLTDEHLFLSGEVDRLQQIVDEYEAAA